MPARQSKVSRILPLSLAMTLLAGAGAAMFAFTHKEAVIPDDSKSKESSLHRDTRNPPSALRNVQAQLTFPREGGTCRLNLRISGAVPAFLTLKLVHGSMPSLDRSVRLQMRSPETYEGPCGNVPAGIWHVELIDEVGGWRLQQDVSGALDGANLTELPAHRT